MPESYCINMLTYACPHGHHIVKGDRVRKCGKDGVWNGTYPECASSDPGPETTTTPSGKYPNYNYMLYSVQFNQYSVEQSNTGQKDQFIPCYTNM